MMSGPRISIVIPTLGGEDTLPAVLEALARQQPSHGPTPVIVALDSSVEDARWLGDVDRWLPLRVEVTRGQIPGASAARNAGWRRADSELVLFLDDDIVPSSKLVAEHLSWHDAHPDPGAGVLGRVCWSSRVKVTAFMRWLDAGVQFDFGTIRSPEAEWWHLYSCNVSLKRAMLDAVDGFDEERFPFGFEDLDLAKRMHRHGFRLLFNPAALGEHLKTETLEDWRRKVERIAVSERRFVSVYPDAPPYFHRRFAAAARAPVAKGRSARLARYVRPGVPWLGPFVWRSFDLVCSQQLAPHFMMAWERADTASATP